MVQASKLKFGSQVPNGPSSRLLGYSWRKLFFILMYVVDAEHIRLSTGSFALIDMNDAVFLCGSTAG